LSSDRSISHPLLKVRLLEITVHEKRRKPAAGETVLQVLVPEVAKIGGHHGRKPDLRLSPGKRVAELRRGLKSGGTRGKNLRRRKVVGGDLEQFRRVGQPVDFIQRHATTAQPFQERFRILHLPTHARKFAVKVLDLGKAPADDGLSCPPHAREPDHGSSLPSLLDSFKPERAWNHT
jgi:hypothetical protein